MTDCIFCRIASHEIGSKVVYEDDEVICFYDIHPAAPVHVLIVPKHHYKDIIDLNSNKEAAADILTAITDAAVKVAEQEGIAEDGFRLINNCGLNGGQTIPHLHFHLLGGVKLKEKLV